MCLRMSFALATVNKCILYPGAYLSRISYVREARYLGIVIRLSGTDKDVHRQMRKYYAGINTLIRRYMM